MIGIVQEIVQDPVREEDMVDVMIGVVDHLRGEEDMMMIVMIGMEGIIIEAAAAVVAVAVAVAGEHLHLWTEIQVRLNPLFIVRHSRKNKITHTNSILP